MPEGVVADNNLATVAFPVISTGVYGYPKRASSPHSCKRYPALLHGGKQPKNSVPGSLRRRHGGYVSGSTR